MGNIYDEVRLALHSIWTRRWLALAVAWGVCLLGWLIVSQIPSKYESRARIFVQSQQLLPPTMNGMPTQSNGGDQIRQTLVSAVNLEKVVRGTDLAATVASERDVADRVAALMLNIKVTPQQDNLFEITTTQTSPKLARTVTQKLIDVFVEANLAGDRTQTASSLRFLDAQLEQRQKALADAEAKRADFQNRYLGSLPGTGSVADRIGAARQQLGVVDGDLAAASSALAAVQGQMASTPATIAGAGTAAGIGPARARLQAINGQLADARTRGYTENHPDVIALRGQLAAANAAARGEPLTGGGAGVGTPNPMYMSLQTMRAEKEAAVASLRIRRAQLQSDLDQLNAKLSIDPQVAAEQGRIERDYQVLKDQYDQLLTQREQINLRGAAQSQTGQVRFSVIDPPTTPRTPAAPNRMLLLSGVLLLGIAAGVGAAFAMGQLRPTFATTLKLERAAAMPVLGAIGEMVTRVQADRRQRKLKLFAGGVGGLAAAYALLLGVELLQRGIAA
ncbi:XrtA system polysaccharide chain length determinant [Sphingomonas sp.]|uniref:XrtA system polysaccharide chain length determinant n=1 Tax=Sphingomonas sp. TaxID=28214 RepID=UPI002D7E8C72|nr:XrtA system polysaccharide chain length determinant [Sphingomonas sp.]HEU0043593.1 XrtA system polysaccharide chain length determinant [Sphingomonas sp.]